MTQRRSSSSFSVALTLTLSIILCCSLLLLAPADASNTDNSWSLSLSGAGLASNPTVLTPADPNLALTVFADPTTPAALNPSSNWQWAGGNATLSTAPSGSDADAAYPGRRFLTNTWFVGGVLQVWSGFGESILADAWNYNRAQNRWSQISSSITQIQGTRNAAGVSSPGARFGSTTALDAVTGRRWLWSGQSSGTYCGDLYSWDGQSATSWTFHAGPLLSAATARYPTMGVPIDGALTTDKNNPAHFQPGGRRYAAGWFSGGCMLQFGGQTSLGAKDDLWAYRVADDKLIWVAGSAGADAAANTADNPYPRYFATAVGPDSQGKMYLFGGYQAYTGYSFSDLWSLTVNADCTAATWTLLSGSQLDHDGPGTYGTAGVYSPLNLPPARNQAYGALDFAGSALLLYGGSSVAADVSSLFSDCWRLDLTTLQWAWIKGTQGSGHADPTYPAGSGVSSALSSPGTRFSGAAFVDEAGSFFIAFGFGKSARNDVWRLAHGPATVTATMTLPSGATLQSRSLSAINGQPNTLVLFEVGTALTAHFTVTSESGVVSEKYSLSLTTALNTATSWTASVNWAGLPSQTRSSAANTVVSLVYQSLPANLGLELSIPYGASISPSSLSVVQSVTAVGTTGNYSFTVTSQSGASSGLQTISWIVQPNTDSSWSALVTVPDVEMRALDSATSDAADGTFLLSYASALDQITFALSLPFGATVNPSSAAPSTTLQLGGGGSSLRYEFTVSAQSGAAAAPFVLLFTVANNTDYGWDADVTPSPGAAMTVVHGTDPPASRVFNVPASAAFTSATIELTLAADATVVPASALSSSLVLGATGSTNFFNYTVLAQSGASSGLISLVFIVAPSESTDWSARVTVPGVADRVLTQNSTDEEVTFFLPESSAHQQAHVTFTVAEGQTIDVGLTPTVSLGGVNSTTSFPFVVTSQSGSATAQGAFRFVVAESTASAWSLLVTPPPASLLAPRRVNSSTALSNLVFRMPAEAAGASVALDFTLGEETTFVSSSCITCSGSSTNPVELSQSVTLGSSNSSALYRFTMRASPDAPELSYSLHFLVDPSANRSWSLVASASALAEAIRVSSDSTAAQMEKTLPTRAAGASLSLAFTLSPGARLVQTSSGDDSLVQSLQLGAKSSSAVFSFVVQAQNGDQSEVNTLRINVAAVDLNAGASVLVAASLWCTLLLASAASVASTLVA